MLAFYDVLMADIYPETINYVDFYRNGDLVCTAS